MRDAAGQLADGFHLLQLVDLRFRRPPLLGLRLQLIVGKLERRHAAAIIEQRSDSEHDDEENAAEQQRSSARVELRRFDRPIFEKLFLSGVHIAKNLADMIHQLLAAVVVDDGERGGRVVGAAQIDRALQLRQLLRRGRAQIREVGHQTAAELGLQSINFLRELASGEIIGSEIELAPGEQVAALSRFRVRGEGLNAFQRVVHLKRMADLRVDLLLLAREEGCADRDDEKENETNKQRDR